MSKRFSKNTLELSFNIDGIPIFNSSNIQFWPILCLAVNESFQKQPFVVAIFCGRSKPLHLEDYLREFVSALNRLISEGFDFCGEVFSVKIKNFVCAALACSYLKCFKSHGGYSACYKCTEYGKYVNGRVVYRSISARSRTDESFRKKTDEDHHKGISPLV